MAKKLPGVFANKIEKELNNNKKVSVTKDESDDCDVRNAKNDININQKIKQIFSSTKYVYKADVEIITKDGKKLKKIVGRNGSNLITIDNELIPISSILDIKYVN